MAGPQFAPKTLCFFWPIISNIFKVTMDIFSNIFKRMWTRAVLLIVIQSCTCEEVTYAMVHMFVLKKSQERSRKFQGVFLLQINGEFVDWVGDSYLRPEWKNPQISNH